MLLFTLSDGGRLLVDPLAVEAVAEHSVRKRQGEVLVCEITLRSGKTYVVSDGDAVIDAVGMARQEAVSTGERIAGALENLGIGGP